MQTTKESIIKEVKPSNVKNKKDFALVGPSHDLENDWLKYIDAYQSSAKILYNNYLEKPCFDTSIDQAIIPLWYILQHTIELCLKTIQIALAQKITANHSKKTIWNNIKKQVVFICADQGIPLDSAKIDNMLKEIEEFDPETTTMRYPTDENNLPSILKMKKVDVANLYKKMTELIENLLRIYFTIDSATNKLKLEEAIKKIIVEEYYEIVPKLQGMLETPSNFEDGSFDDFLNHITHNQAVTIVLLMYAGRDICDGVVYPSKKKLRRDELIKVMQSHIYDTDINYENDNCDRFILVEGLISKAPELVIRYVKTAMRYFDI